MELLSHWLCVSGIWLSCQDPTYTPRVWERTSKIKPVSKCNAMAGKDNNKDDERKPHVELNTKPILRSSKHSER